jgi:group I intron endonuclease
MKNTTTLQNNLNLIRDLIGKQTIYTNLTSDIKIIYKDNNGKSGIYCLTNIITGKIYIGSAVNLTRRFREYFSIKYLTKELLVNNSYIYRALLKYGYSNFKLEIMEYCNKESLISREQYYIDLLKPEYNLCLIAGSSLGRLVRKDTRLKLRNAKIRRLYVESNGITLREHSINFIDQKLNQSRLKIDKFYKEFAKIKLLIKKKVRRYNPSIYINTTTIPSQVVLVTDTFNNVTMSFPSIRRAALAINVSHSTLGSRLRGKTTKLCKNRYIIRSTSNK